MEAQQTLESQCICPPSCAAHCDPDLQHFLEDSPIQTAVTYLDSSVYVLDSFTLLTFSENFHAYYEPQCFNLALFYDKETALRTDDLYSKMMNSAPAGQVMSTRLISFGSEVDRPRPSASAPWTHNSQVKSRSSSTSFPAPPPREPGSSPLGRRASHCRR